METDLGTGPLQYSPDDIDAAPIDNNATPVQEQQQQAVPEEYYEEQQQQYHHQQQPQYMDTLYATEPPKKTTLDLTSVDQSTVMLCFAAFLFGFVVSKLTMQPIILKQ